MYALSWVAYNTNSPLYMYIASSYVILMLFTSCNPECNKVFVFVQQERRIRRLSHVHLANNFSQGNWVKVYAKRVCQEQLLSHIWLSQVWLDSDLSHVRNLKAYNSVISERKHKVWVFIFLERKEQFVTKIIS